MYLLYIILTIWKYTNIHHYVTQSAIRTICRGL